jgi:hypothetical protein
MFTPSVTLGDWIFGKNYLKPARVYTTSPLVQTLNYKYSNYRNKTTPREVKDFYFLLKVLPAGVFMQETIILPMNTAYLVHYLKL